MTAQFGERLLYEGEWCSMCDTPLSMYFSLSKTYPEFSVTSTACWRGYVGSWEVIEDRLYLIGIDAQLLDETYVTLEMSFPGYSKRVFAHWYSGEIRIPQGQLVEYVHAGYASRYERDLFLTVLKGVIISTEITTNGSHEEKSDPKGYEVGSFLTLDKEDK